MSAELELSYGKAMSQLQFTPRRLWLTDAGRLYDSITSLQTAVLVITVVIGILCVLETIAIIYRILIEGRQSQRYSEYLERYQRQSRRTSRSGRMRSTTSASRSSRSADRRHRPSKTKSRDGAKKLKRSKPNEPSKTSTVRISLDHEEDDSVPKETPAEKRYRSRSRSTSDSGAPRTREFNKSEPYGVAEQVNADIRELAQEKGDGCERVTKDSSKGDVKIDIEQDKARKSSDSGADSAHETGIRIKDSLVAASAPPNYVAVSDKDLDSAAKKTPGSPQQQSPAHLFGDQHNDVKPVAKDSLNQVGDKNFIPVAELPGENLVGSIQKTDSATKQPEQTSKSDQKSGPIETPTDKQQDAALATAKEMTPKSDANPSTKSSNSNSDDSKSRGTPKEVSTPKSDSNKTPADRGEMKEFKIGI